MGGDSRNVSLDGIGDCEDLRIRLDYVKDASERLVIVAGSGISTTISNTEAMTRRFYGAMSSRGRERFGIDEESIFSGGLDYQNAASRLKVVHGDVALARTVRGAVLDALSDGLQVDIPAITRDAGACDELVFKAEWNVPPACLRLSEFYQTIPSRVAGPIITTNFDPMIEVAFRDKAKKAHPFPIPYDSAPTQEQIRNQPGVPVLHIHGYWTSNATLSTITHLTAPRANLRRMLEGVLTNATVLVVGYSGWRDAFMDSLVEVFRRADDLNCEILWASYSKSLDEVLENEYLRGLYRSPNFGLYLGVEASELFDVRENTEGRADSIYGYSQVPAADPVGAILPRFVDGGPVTWGDSAVGVWPKLTSTRSLEQELARLASLGGGGGVVAIGPVGEGKSLALRQALVEFSEADDRSDWRTIWREPGAPRMNAEWWAEAVPADTKLIVGIDDIDLVFNELAETREIWGSRESGIVIVGACHDRLWTVKGRPALGANFTEILFSGVDEHDARLVAESWISHDVVEVETSHDEAIDHLSHRLLAASRSLDRGTPNSLFGAALELLSTDGLQSRVGDLLSRLSSRSLDTPLVNNLGQVFGAICVIQAMCDPYGGETKGVTRRFLSELTSTSEPIVDGKILRELGREAAISILSDRIYARHPAIAQAVLAELRKSGQIGDVLKAIAACGSRMRFAEHFAPEDYLEPYRLTRRLVDAGEVNSACTGLVSGAPDRLEPRVTAVSARRHIDPDSGYSYAKRIAPLVERYQDVSSAIRAFLNEYALCALSVAEPTYAMGLAAIGLEDRVGQGLDPTRADYLLTTFAKASMKLDDQMKSGPSPSTGSALRLLDRIGRSDVAKRFAAGCLDRGYASDFAGRSMDSIVQTFAQEVRGPLLNALMRSEIAVEWTGAPRFHDLLRLAHRRY